MSTIPVILGTTVNAKEWEAWFGAHGAATKAQRMEVVKTYHAWFQEAGVSVYQPHWWAWPGMVMRDEKTAEDCYRNGVFTVPEAVTTYLQQWQGPYFWQVLGLYHRRSYPQAFAPGGVHQDKADLPAFYRAAWAYWSSWAGTGEGRAGVAADLPTVVRPYVFFDEVAPKLETVESLERTRRLNDAAKGAGWETVICLTDASKQQWLIDQGIRPSVWVFRLDPSQTGSQAYSAAHRKRATDAGEAVAFYVVQHPAVETGATVSQIGDLLRFCQREQGRFLLYWNVLGPGGTVYRRAHPWFKDGYQPTELAQAWKEAAASAEQRPPQTVEERLNDLERRVAVLEEEKAAAMAAALQLKAGG